MADDSNLSCINADNSLSKQDILISLDNSTAELQKFFEEKRELANQENARSLLVDFNSWLAGLYNQEALVNSSLLRDLFLQWVRLNLILKPFVQATSDPKKLWDGFYRPFLYGDYSYYKNDSSLPPEEWKGQADKWYGAEGNFAGAWVFYYTEGFFPFKKTVSLIDPFLKEYFPKSARDPSFDTNIMPTLISPWNFSIIPGIMASDLNLGMSEPKKAKQYVATSKQACIRKWNTERFRSLQKDIKEEAGKVIDAGTGVLGDTLLIVGVGIAGAIVLGFTVSALLRD